MQDLGTKVLETPRLILRPFTVDDAPAMFANWASDGQVTQYLTWPTHNDPSVSRAYCEGVQGSYGDPRHYEWAIVLRELGEPVGSISVVGRHDGAESMQVGYCIGRKWWRQGITSEALARVIRFLFEEVGCLRVEARHDSQNPRSGAVMARCGMAREGLLRRSDRNNRGICDAVWYGILKEDYEKGR